MLVDIKQLFPNSGRDVLDKFAYPAFNTQNLEIPMGLVWYYVGLIC